jgi:uncharacterized protein (DUF3084 family)
MRVKTWRRRRRIAAGKANLPRRDRRKSYAFRVSRFELLELRELLHGDPLHHHSHPTPLDLAENQTASAAVIDPDAATAAFTPQALLPDFIPWASESRGFMYGWTIQGNELRLTTAMANIGTGPMELRGGAIVGNSQEVNQRIYEPDGSFSDVLAGTFTYHPEHGHIHFDGFAEYRLREVLPNGEVGAILSTGDKISFCLLDIERYDTSGPASPFYLTCGHVQGVSPGWADIYDRGLDGQSIDITNVPDGNYWLEVVVDPDNQLIEANENNNAERIQIVLQRGPSTPADTFEPNDSFAAASILAPPEDHIYDELSIHAAGNDDYYRVTASATGTLRVSLAFQHAQGDIDLEMFDASFTRLGLSDSVQNAEQLGVNAIAGQIFYIRAYGYNGATNPNYTLSIDQADANGIPSDVFEDNDTFATARNLPPANQSYATLSIDTINDNDYYSLTPALSGTITVSLAFLHAQGDIDLELLSSTQTRLGLSETTGNAEQLSFPVTAGTTYVIRVFGFNGAVNPNYSMTINAPGLPPADALEENDTFATASILAAADQSYPNLTINAPNDDDYYALIPTATGTLDVSLAFLNALGNVNLELFDAAQQLIASSSSTADAEQLSMPVISGQTYYLRVFGAGGAVSPNYSMTINAPELPPADSFEENDTFATASVLAASDQTYSNLTINTPNDDDYYSIVPTATGSLDVGLAFLNSQGDVNLELLDGAQQLLASSASTGDAEQISLQVAAGQTYLIRVFGFNGAMSPNYSMTINAPALPPADVLEENDTFATASSLAASDQTYTNLTINAPNDDDYYSLVPAATGTLDVSLAFLNSQGDVNLELFDAAQQLLASSVSTTDAEQVSLAVTAGQTYYIRVFGAGGAVNPNYSMTINAPELPPADALEENDTFATARALASSDQTYTNLTINAPNDDDYYALAPTATGTLDVSLSFLNAQGDINLELFDAAQQLLASSVSTTDAEQISLAVTAGQTYYIRVFGAAGAVNPNHSLTINAPELPNDVFEENDTFATAGSLAALDQTYSNLTINAPNDDDFFSLVPTVNGTLSVTLTFLNSQGNVDLELFNAAQQLLASSGSTADTEQVTLPVTAGQTYFVRVFGAGGAINPNYSLKIDVPEAPPGDVFEDNDTFATARSLPASNQSYTGLSIDAPNDNDYYSLVPTTTGTLTVSLAFLHAQGDIDLELLSATQTRLGLSETTGNAEQLSLPVTAGQTYVIRVFGFNGAVNPNYSMTLGFAAPPPSADYYFSLASNGTLTSTNGSPSLAFTDADILKLTVLGNGQYGYQLHFDGSDVGLTTSNEDIDAFELLADGSILVSTVGAFSVPAPSGPALTGNGEDLLRFVPTSLGATTAGQWSIYFDGSDVGLSGTAENIDAVQRLSDGRLLISTTGNVSVTGASGADEDLVAFTPTTLGATTAGSWSFYFDGSDVALTSNDSEDIRALYVSETTGNPTLFFGTLGNFFVTGLSGANEDVFAFNPTSLGSTTAGTFGPGLALRGSSYGLASFALDGIHLGALPSAGQAAILSGGSALPIASPFAANNPSYRSRPSGSLAASSAKASLRVELASDALAAAVLKSSAPNTTSTNGVDCGCHAQAAAPIAARSYRPIVSDDFTIWDVLGDLPDDAGIGQLS